METVEQAGVEGQNAFASDLKNARDFIIRDLAKAHAADADAMRLRAASHDPSQADFRLAELISRIRGEVSQIVDFLESGSGERWTVGIKASHFVREVRNAAQALALADLQAARLNFVVDEIGCAVPSHERKEA